MWERRESTVEQGRFQSLVTVAVDELVRGWSRLPPPYAAREPEGLGCTAMKTIPGSAETPWTCVPDSGTVTCTQNSAGA